MSTRTLETASFDILYKQSRTHIPVGINPILIVRALLPLLLAVDRVLFIPLSGTHVPVGVISIFTGSLYYRTSDTYETSRTC